MKTLCIAAAAALLLSDPAGAATVKYKGHSYGSFDTSYFTDNPTAVGTTRPMRFTDDYCVFKAEQLKTEWGDELQSCTLLSANAGSPVEPGSFFSFSVDGFKGGPLARTWFFTVTFAPTYYIDPLTTDADEFFKLVGTIAYDISWSSKYAGNNTENLYYLIGTVIPPAPVPLPASGALAAVGLAALTALRRKSRKV